MTRRSWQERSGPALADGPSRPGARPFILRACRTGRSSPMRAGISLQLKSMQPFTARKRLRALHAGGRRRRAVLSSRSRRRGSSRTGRSSPMPGPQWSISSGGLVNLKEKLGPVNWQFAPPKRFDPADFEAFLKLLPGSIEGQRMRHAVDVRHKSFRTPEFVELLRAYKVAAIFTDKEGLPQIPDLTAPFVYARLQRISEKEASGYPEQALDQWAKRAAAWARGECPDGLDPVSAAQNAPPKARDVFIYFIDGFKPKAPAAAMALIARLKGEAPRKNG